jgi:hypothetical protein
MMMKIMINVYKNNNHDNEDDDDNDNENYDSYQETEKIVYEMQRLESI